MPKVARRAAKQTTAKVVEKEATSETNKLQPHIPPINGQMTIEELLKCLPQQLVAEHGEEIKSKSSYDEAEKFVEELLDKMFEEENVDDSFWAENPDDLPLDKDMKEYGEELDRMRLQD